MGSYSLAIFVVVSILEKDAREPNASEASNCRRLRDGCRIERR